MTATDLNDLAWRLALVDSRLPTVNFANTPDGFKYQISAQEIKD